MIADLVGGMNDLECCYWDNTYSSVLFPDPAERSSHQCKARARGWKDLRFPWIHKSDPIAFHCANTLLSKNHAAVPRCRAIEA
jgi:hypothetical protein